jgi:hypothetical protein
VRHVDGGFKRGACGAEVGSNLDLVEKAIMSDCPKCLGKFGLEAPPAATSLEVYAEAIRMVIFILKSVPPEHQMTVAVEAARRSIEADAKPRAPKGADK